MTDREALFQRFEGEIRRIVNDLDALSLGRGAALHLVWAADLLAIERKELRSRVEA